MIREERFDPCAKQGGEAKVLKNVDNTSDVDVVEETLDVKKNNGCDKATLNCSLGLVGEAQGGVHHAVVVP